MISGSKYTFTCMPKVTRKQKVSDQRKTIAMKGCDTETEQLWCKKAPSLGMLLWALDGRVYKSTVKTTHRGWQDEITESKFSFIKNIKSRLWQAAIEQLQNRLKAPVKKYGRNTRFYVKFSRPKGSILLYDRYGSAWVLKRKRTHCS